MRRKYVVDALASDRSNQPFGEAILPKGGYRRLADPADQKELPKRVNLFPGVARSTSRPHRARGYRNSLAFPSSTSSRRPNSCVIPAMAQQSGPSFARSRKATRKPAAPSASANWVGANSG